MPMYGVPLSQSDQSICSVFQLVYNKTIFASKYCYLVLYFKTYAFSIPKFLFSKDLCLHFDYEALLMESDTYQCISCFNNMVVFNCL